MHRVPLLASIAAAALALLGCRTPPERMAERAGAPVRITLVATSDLHGWVHPFVTRLDDGSAVEEGGLSALAGYLAILRAEDPSGVVLLDAGDLFQGTLAANLTEGQVVIDAYNRLGYAAAALGNHEFDYGPVGPVSVATESGQDPFGALKARLAAARFPVLAVNVYEKGGARPAWLGNDGTAIVEAKGLRIGIVGLITPSTPHTTNPVNVRSLRFAPLASEAAAAAERLRAKGADVLVAVAHAGGKCARHEDPDDVSSCDATSEIFELLEGVPRGSFDAVIAGHTHFEIAHRVNGIPVVQTRGLGRALALIELWVDPKTRRALPERTVIGRNVSICARMDDEARTCDPRALRGLGRAPRWVPATFRGQPVTPDAEIDRLLAPVLARVEAEQRRKLGVKAPRPLLRSYEAESALGNVIADSLRQMEQADVALLNSGGLRADLPAGELEYGDVYQVIPFDNAVATITVTGAELHRLLHAAYGARKGVFQVSGLRATLERCPGEQRLRGLTLGDGRPVSEAARYRVVMPDFLARGGDGLGPALESLSPERIDLGLGRELNLRDALVGWWQRRGALLVAPPSGRIRFVDGGSCSEGETLDPH